MTENPVSIIPTEAWELLTDVEQKVLLAISDYEAGRFDVHELRLRVQQIRKVEERLNELNTHGVHVDTEVERGLKELEGETEG